MVLLSNTENSIDLLKLVDTTKVNVIRIPHINKSNSRPEQNALLNQVFGTNSTLGWHRIFLLNLSNGIITKK